MSDRRLKFHEVLCNEILNCPTSGLDCRAYLQAPSSGMTYPAIVYSLDDVKMKHADNKVYDSTRCYSVTLIDKNPDSQYVEKLLSLITCKFSRFYVADNLNHFVFEVYY